MAADGLSVQRFASHDPAEAHEILTELYGAHRPSFSGEPDDFDFRLLYRTAGELGSDTLRHTMATRAVVDPLDYFLAVDVLDGALTLEAGRDKRRLDRGAVGCHPSDATVTVTWDHLDAAFVRLPLDTIARVAAERNGSDGRALRFDGSAPVSTALAFHWRSMSQFLRMQLSTRDSVLGNALLRAHTVDLVAATVLASFPNTMMTIGYRPGPGRVAPAALRRAVAYIDANAHSPITLTDLAAAAGTSVRALQFAFRRHYDTTPTGYVRRARLEHAHRELQSGDPHTASVAAIAAKWGFAHPARFAAYYRAQYGRPPSQTLRG